MKLRTLSRKFNPATPTENNCVNHYCHSDCNLVSDLIRMKILHLTESPMPLCETVLEKVMADAEPNLSFCCPW